MEKKKRPQSDFSHFISSGRRFKSLECQESFLISDGTSVCQKLKNKWGAKPSDYPITLEFYFILYNYYWIRIRRIKLFSNSKKCLGFEWICMNHPIDHISDWLIARNIAACSAGIEFKLKLPVHKNCFCLYNFDHCLLKHLISSAV